MRFGRERNVLTCLHPFAPFTVGFPNCFYITGSASVMRSLPQRLCEHEDGRHVIIDPWLRTFAVRSEILCFAKPWGILWKDKGMPKGWLYDWEDMAMMGRQNSETRFCRKLACCLSECVLAISNRSLKDSSCTHKGLLTNWAPPQYRLRLPSSETTA
jgi:hypothetical protein